MAKKSPAQTPAFVQTAFARRVKRGHQQGGQHQSAAIAEEDDQGSRRYRWRQSQDNQLEEEHCAGGKNPSPPLHLPR